MGKRELVALLNLSSWCLLMVERLFLAMPWCCLQFVIVVFPDHTHLLAHTLRNIIEIDEHSQFHQDVARVICFILTVYRRSRLI